MSKIVKRSVAEEDGSLLRTGDLGGSTKALEISSYVYPSLSLNIPQGMKGQKWGFAAKLGYNFKLQICPDVLLETLIEMYMYRHYCF